jgi:hypothetical protein
MKRPSRGQAVGDSTGWFVDTAAMAGRWRGGPVPVAALLGRNSFTERATALMCAGVVPQHPPTSAAPLAANLRAASAKYSVFRA